MSNPVITWQIKPFESLTVHELYDILKFRSDVFVVEQDCVYSDMDDLDTRPDTLHVFAYEGDEFVGTCRLLAPTVAYDDYCAIGRVLINETKRNRQLAEQMMKAAIHQTTLSWPGVDCKISAQQHLEAFYQRLGFKTVSDMYLEDGIPHISMLRKTK